MSFCAMCQNNLPNIVEHYICAANLKMCSKQCFDRYFKKSRYGTNLEFPTIDDDYNTDRCVKRHKDMSENIDMDLD